MGTKWELDDDGHQLTVTQLAKPYVGELPDLADFKCVATSSADGKRVVFSLPRNGMNPTTPLMLLLRAGYLNLAQRVILAPLDKWVAVVSFEDQLPLGVNRGRVLRTWPTLHVVEGVRTLTIGSPRRVRQDVDEAIRWLWAILKEDGVVTGGQPKFWR